MPKPKSQDRPKQKIFLSVYDPAIKLSSGDILAGKHIIRQAISMGRVIFTEFEPSVIVGADAKGVLIKNCIFETL